MMSHAMQNSVPRLILTDSNSLIQTLIYERKQINAVLQKPHFSVLSELLLMG